MVDCVAVDDLREPSGRFVNGHAAHPLAGRPRMTEGQRIAKLMLRRRELEAKVLEIGDALATLERGAPIAAEVVIKMLHSDSESTRLAAAKVVLAYHLGTPRVQQPASAASATVEEGVSDEELTRRLEALAPLPTSLTDSIPISSQAAAIGQGDELKADHLTTEE